LLSIINMMRTLALDWDECRLAMLKFEAEILVARFRQRIHRVAGGLIEHGLLTSDGIRFYIKTARAHRFAPNGLAADVFRRIASGRVLSQDEPHVLVEQYQ
jgi:hypothetical protein